MIRPFHLRAHDVLPLRAAGTALVSAGVVVGVIAYQRQFSQGMSASGLRDVVPWGAYTVAYLAFVAVSAGALAIACYALLAPRAHLTPIVPAALVTAVAGLVAAVAAFVVNLGRPSRMYNLVLHPNWSSPTIWSLYAVLATLAVAAALLALGRRRHGGRSVAPRLLSLAGFATALLCAAAAAGIFTFQRARPAWSNGLVMPLFLTSAAVAGTATVLLVARTARVVGAKDGTGILQAWLRRLMAATLAASLVLTAIGYLTAVRSSPGRWAAMQLVLPGGRWSWLFWTQWLVGGVAPLACLVHPALRNRRRLTEAAAALAVLGVVASYVTLVPGGLASPLITLPPGMALGAPMKGVSFEALGFYHPTWTEYGVLIGLACIFVALLGLALDARRAGAEAAG